MSVVKHGPTVCPGIDSSTFRRIQASRASNAQAVEGNVPYQFLPMGGGEIFRYRAGNAGVGYRLGDAVGAGLGRPAIFAHDNGAVREMQNYSRRDAIQTYKT